MSASGCDAGGVRHGYTNQTELVQEGVRKTYDGPDAVARKAAERRALKALAGRFPVPRLIGEDPDSLTTGYVAGTHGQDLIDLGHAHGVLAECGRVLRALHAISARVVHAGAERNAVIRHGDFGPNNVLFDPTTFTAIAVLDWEFSGTGSAITDLAWCEWIVRMHLPDAIDELADFYDAYGSCPPWRDRQREMVRRCQWLEEFSRRRDATSPGLETWRVRRHVAEKWVE